MLSMLEHFAMKSMLLGFFTPAGVNWHLRWFCRAVKCPSHINYRSLTTLVHPWMFANLSSSASFTFFVDTSSPFASPACVSSPRKSSSDYSSGSSSPTSTSALTSLPTSPLISFAIFSFAFCYFFTFWIISSFAFFSVKYFLVISKKRCSISCRVFKNMLSSSSFTMNS